MSQKQISKNNTVIDFIAPAVYAVIFIIVTFLQSKAVALGPKGSILQGVSSQLLILFSAFVVVAFPRFGYYTAVGVNLISIVRIFIALRTFAVNAIYIQTFFGVTDSLGFQKSHHHKVCIIIIFMRCGKMQIVLFN